MDSFQNHTSNPKWNTNVDASTLQTTKKKKNNQPTNPKNWNDHVPLSDWKARLEFAIYEAAVVSMGSYQKPHKRESVPKVYVYYATPL